MTGQKRPFSIVNVESESASRQWEATERAMFFGNAVAKIPQTELRRNGARCAVGFAKSRGQAGRLVQRDFDAGGGPAALGALDSERAAMQSG